MYVHTHSHENQIIIAPLRTNKKTKLSKKVIVCGGPSIAIFFCFSEIYKNQE